VPSLAACRPSGSKQWAELRVNDGSIDSRRQGKSQVQDPKETRQETGLGTRLQCGSKVHPGDRARDKSTYSIALAGSGLKWGFWAYGQGWGETQVWLVRATKAPWCPQGPETVKAIMKWCWLRLFSQLGGFFYVLAFSLFNYPIWKCTFGDKKPLSPNLTGGSWVLGQWVHILTTWTGLHLSYWKPPLPPSPLGPSLPTTVPCPAKMILLRQLIQQKFIFFLPFKGSFQTNWWPDLTQCAAVGSRVQAGSEMCCPCMESDCVLLGTAWSKLDLSWWWNTHLSFGLCFQCPSKTVQRSLEDARERLL